MADSDPHSNLIPPEQVTGHGHVTTADVRCHGDGVEAGNPVSVLDERAGHEARLCGSGQADGQTATLLEAGWSRQWAWLEPTSGRADSSTAQKVSSSASRKRAQRARDGAEGWRECTVKAPNDKDARELLASIGLGLIDPGKRAAIRAALSSDQPSQMTHLSRPVESDP